MRYGGTFSIEAFNLKKNFFFNILEEIFCFLPVNASNYKYRNRTSLILIDAIVFDSIVQESRDERIKSGPGPPLKPYMYSRETASKLTTLVVW